MILNTKQIIGATPDTVYYGRFFYFLADADHKMNNGWWIQNDIDFFERTCNDILMPFVGQNVFFRVFSATTGDLLCITFGRVLVSWVQPSYRTGRQHYLTVKGTSDWQGVRIPEHGEQVHIEIQHYPCGMAITLAPTKFNDYFMIDQDGQAIGYDDDISKRIHELGLTNMDETKSNGKLRLLVAATSTEAEDGGMAESLVEMWMSHIEFRHGGDLDSLWDCRFLHSRLAGSVTPVALSAVIKAGLSHLPANTKQVAMSLYFPYHDPE